MEVKCDMVTVVELSNYKIKSARTGKLQLCSKQTCTVRNSHNTVYYLPDLYFHVSRYTLLPDEPSKLQNLNACFDYSHLVIIS